MKDRSNLAINPKRISNHHSCAHKLVELIDDEDATLIEEIVLRLGLFGSFANVREEVFRQLLERRLISKAAEYEREARWDER